MKLLIVDDEELTRTGVITSLDWASLGIDEVHRQMMACTVLKQHGAASRKSFCVMCVCPAWMVFPCWSVWKKFFRIPFPSS